ncbi:recombinase family protein [Methylocella sp.]|uniref:recombinase family protein n=1 Tax=Methylocella sp. TaxID=1978226 RepID=UPI0035B02EE7
MFFTLANPLKTKGLDRSKPCAYNAAMKIGYARVSTDEQNLDPQLHALAQAGCESVFEDRGVSGASSQRPGLLAALAAAKEGDTLVVWRIDRLGRSTLHLLQLLDHLRGRGVGFLSIMDGIDTTTAAGRMAFTMIGTIAEFERSMISERTRAGIATARRRGKRIGRPPKVTPDQLDYARERIEAGEGRAAVARKLGIDPSSLRRLLNAPPGGTGAI